MDDTGCSPRLVLLLVIAILLVLAGVSIADSLGPQPSVTVVTAPAQAAGGDMGVFEKFIALVLLALVVIVVALGGIAAFVVALNNTTRR